MKKILLIAFATALVFGAIAASANGPITKPYSDVILSGGFQASHFPEAWDLTACDLTLSFSYDANGLVDDWGGSAHAWAELGVRQFGYGDFNPTWMAEGAGVWLATDYDWSVNTFDPDPVGSPTLDLDDKLILQKGGGQGEGNYNLPSAPTNPWANHRVWFDRDGVDQWQAQNPLAVDGGTYNTSGTYDVVITLHANDASSGTAYMTINGLAQGFETDGDWSTMELTPAGMTFSGDMTEMQVFYGLYGYGATHSVAFQNIAVSGCPGAVHVEIDLKPGSYPNAVNIGSNGVIPVAILSSAEFDVTQVNPCSVALAGSDVAVRGKGKCLGSSQDVNGDGLLDLVVQVETENLDPNSLQDGNAVLSGETYAGTAIAGQDEITIIPPGGSCPTCSCTTIQDGLFASTGESIVLGYDQFGYNYQAHMFNGRYCDYDRVQGGDYCDVQLIMKWNDAWLSNMDCDGDGKLDRHYGFDSYLGSGAWETNHQWGAYEQDGKTCWWTYFVKIIAAPADASSVGGIWYAADGTEIGPAIWGSFAKIQMVENDPCAGIHGLQYSSPDHPGFGGW